VDTAGDSPTIRFGVFEINLRTGELRKAGRKIRIQEQPVCVLVSLLERPGELVTRDELRQKVWQSDTFVDFDAGLNKAINKIRDVLDDSAASPRFIETLPKRGYRFIAPIEKIAPQREAPRTVEQIGAKIAKWAAAIAVLPFANMSTDKENEYFSDGLSEEIINALTKVPGLRVIARTSAFRFRGEQDLRKVGEVLQVDTVLEGSVRKIGNRLRITAQLINAADDSHIWSERYDRELTDVFAIQDEISAAVVDQLKVSLGRPAEAKRPTPKLGAYEAVLEGRFHWYRFTPADLAKALECFERAIAIDPEYAEAYVGLAHYYVQMAYLGRADPRTVLLKAKAAAERATEVDPALAVAHAALAQAFPRRTGSGAGAVLSSRRLRRLIFAPRWTPAGGFVGNRSGSRTRPAVAAVPNRTSQGAGLPKEVRRSRGILQAGIGYQLRFSSCTAWIGAIAGLPAAV
jgi:TolB-like protein